MKKLLLAVALSVAAAGAVKADAISDQVVANLKAQGYAVVQMDRTWLGRIWILARSDTVQREVVFNPGTGEILRDYAVKLTTLAAEEQRRREDDNDSVASSGGTGTVTSPADGGTQVDPADTGDAIDVGNTGDAAPKAGAGDGVVIEPINPLP